MPHSYKIFINEVPVHIIAGERPEDIITIDEKHPVFSFEEKKEIEKAFHLLENNAGIKSLRIYAPRPKEMRNLLFADYKKIRAAGGLVFNNKDEILLIFRKNMWDLPKGKIDPGEKKKAAALREVREETGLFKLSVVKKLMKTYHTYLLENNQRVLKVTHWYLMMCSDDKQPVPQAEENIEIVLWVPADKAQDKLNKAYANIADVVTTGIQVMHRG